MGDTAGTGTNEPPGVRERTIARMKLIACDIVVINDMLRTNTPRDEFPLL